MAVIFAMLHTQALVLPMLRNGPTKGKKRKLKSDMLIDGQIHFPDTLCVKKLPRVLLVAENGERKKAEC